VTLKILHVITTIERGGAEKQLLILARNQVQLGENVSVYYLKGRPDLLQDFETSGVKVFHSSKNFLFNLVSLNRVLRLNFDVVHAHLPRAELQLALSTFFTYTRAILIASRHNSEAFFPKSPKFFSSWLSRITLQKYSGVIFISTAVKQFVEASQEKTKATFSKVIYYGYDEKSKVNDFDSSKSALSNDSFLFVGRLTKQKNIPFLLNAFRQHLESHPYSKLDIYGSGELEKELQESTSDLSSNVFWRGKSESIQKIMGSYKCLILPSFYEGFGLVLLEAMQNRLPILAANSSAIPEVLGSEYPGLFNLDDQTSLVHLLDKVEDQAFRGSLVALQEERLKLFDPRTMSQNVQAFYMQSQS